MSAKVFENIESGLHDRRLDRIIRAAQARKRLLAADLMVTLLPGDRLKISSSCRRAELRGAIGTVVRKGRTRVLLTVERFGQAWCPIVLLERAPERRLRAAS